MAAIWLDPCFRHAVVGHSLDTAASPPAARLSAAELESVFAVAKLTQYVDKFRQAGFTDGRDIVSAISTRPAIRGPIVC